MTRCFVAIPIPGQLQTELDRLQSGVCISGIRWVKPKNMHLSLQFLGDLTGSDIDRVKQILSNIAASNPPFTVSVFGIGVFPSWRRIRVMWTGFKGNTDKLNHMAVEFRDQMKRNCIAEEDKPFRAHITLGRVKHPRPDSGLSNVLKQFTDKQWGELPVSRIVLYESVLQPTGPIYSELASFELTG